MNLTRDIRRVRWVLPIAALSCFVGCASPGKKATRHETVAEHPGDAVAPPSLDALPTPLPVDHQAVHDALTLAGQIFAAPLPTPPADRANASLSVWVDGEVASWIVRRRESVEETRFLFRLPAKDAEDEPSDEEIRKNVVARAVLGLLQEDTALQLSRIPAPSELDSEPEIAAMFDELVKGRAEPFVYAAQREYVECANAGYRFGDELEPLARFCHARHDKLAAVVGR